MPTNEHIWRVAFELRKDAPGIFWGSPSDVGYPKGQAFELEDLMFWPSASNRFPIDVAEHGTTVSHLTQSVGDLHVADVTGVPHLIAPLCVAEDAFVHVSMGVRKKHNLHGARAKSVEMPHFRFMNLMRITLGVTMAVMSTAGNVAISQLSKPSKRPKKPLQRPWKRTGFCLTIWRCRIWTKPSTKAQSTPRRGS